MVSITEVREEEVGAGIASTRRQQLLADGNRLYVDEDFEGARDCFSRANEVVPGVPSADALSRRAAANIKLGNFEDAIADVNKAVNLEPTALSYLRKGVACFELDEHEAALTAFQEGAKLASGTFLEATLRTWMRKAKAELQDDDSSSNRLPQPGPGATGAPAPAAQQEPSAGAAAEDANGRGVSGAMAAAAGLPASAPAPAPAPSAPAPAPPPRFRHEWYQSSGTVVVSVFAKGLKSEELSVEFGEQVLCVTIKAPEDEPPYVLMLRLFGKIKPEECKYTILSTKVEVKLVKAEAIQWSGLEAAARSKAVVVQPINESTDVPGVKASYPSSSKHKVDWNKLEAEVKIEEKEEKLDGDAGLNRFFQQIYGDSDEDTRRAMNKSFVESGGTVLSTN